MSTERKSESSDLSLIAQAIRRRLKIVVICLIVGIAGAVVLTIQSDKQYSATSSILLNPSSGFEPQRTVETNLELLGLPLLAVRTAEEVGGLSSSEVSSAVSVSQQGESNIVQVEATTDDPDLAAEIANSYAEQYVLFQEGGEREKFAGRVRVVERAVPDDTPVSPKPTRNV
ncbi:MAG TPA: Wzz/FepE/Etk N-terminal domain-containing protein, partial [Solirubrobacterales bacterium]|nr:Wzz/FepE/Etk N-terminal domain-containing protein [Solirubrobacterales bacterium]